ncbi:MAG TPA: GntR family transcriptional regulator [Clostridia bacterium]|nr:GntR family transcriptional regulator [Clostridia bacterium]
MEFDNSKPIYLQIVDKIKGQLIRNELNIGDKIPSQRELAQRLKVNPNTVQRAYNEMEIMGMVETLRGQGTFICKKPEMLKEIKEEMLENIMGRFFHDIKSLGYEDEEIVDLIDRWQIKLGEGEK